MRRAPEIQAPWERYRTDDRDRSSWLAVVLPWPVVFLVALALLVGADSPAATDWFLGVLIATVVVAPAILFVARGQPEHLTVSAAGIRPSRRHGVFIPADQVRGAVVRRWTSSFPPATRGGGGGISLVRQAISLTDGREAMVPALQRPTRPDRATRIWISTSEAPTWAPLLDDTGAPVGWARENDDEVTALLAARWRAIAPAIRGPEASAGPEAQRIDLRALWSVQHEIRVGPGLGGGHAHHPDDHLHLLMVHRRWTASRLGEGN